MRELIPYLKLYKKHWFGLTLGIWLALATLLSSIGLLTLSGWFLSAAAVAGLTIARETFNYMLPGAGVRGAAMARTAGRWGERVVSHDATFKLLTDLRLFFFRRLAPLIPSSKLNIRDADMLNRLVADVDAMDHVYLRLVSPIISGLLAILCLTAVLAWFDTTLGLVLGGSLLVILLVWPVIFYHLGAKNGEQLTHNKSALRIKALDWLQGYSELTLFGAESRYREVVLQAQQKLVANQLHNAKISGLAQALLMLANGWLLVSILWLAADGVGGNAPDPMIALMAFAALASVELMMPIAGAFQYLGQTLTSAKRLNEIILSQPEVVFPEVGVEHSNNYSIKISNATFHYPNNDNLIVNNVTLELHAGQKLALLGQTGSGKSTLLQLLVRQWELTQGSIQIAEADIHQWSETQLRQAICVVSQKVDVLNGSLRDNLTIASPDASDSELMVALNNVGLDTLLRDQGLDTWLGEGGRQLSGGEKRRIGIARALLHNAPILLLDEPTEGLDKKTEQQVMAILEQHFNDKTVLFITHRLVNLHKFDAICLLEQGELVEHGNHSTLMAQQGRYYQLNQTL